MGTKHVKGGTTSLNGCRVEIDGDVVYALIPPHITGFRGVIHISGNTECPNGDLHFEIEPKGKVAKAKGPNERKP